MQQKTAPISEACERNKGPIKEVLCSELQNTGRLLEMGHGTGQHALYFAQNFPHIHWYACDSDDYHWMLKQRMGLKPLKNLKGPYQLYVEHTQMHQQLLDQKLPVDFEYFFTANTLHIMGQKQVDLFCQEVSQCLAKGAKLFLYGPFRFAGKYTSTSNKNFDENLRHRDPLSGIKDFERIEGFFKDFDIKFIKRHDLPANNQLLIFQHQ